MPAAASKAFLRLLDEIGTVDAVGIEERVAKYTTRSIKKASKVWGLKMAVSMVDLTTLEGKDTPGQGRLPLRQGAAPARRPDSAAGRGGLRLSRQWSGAPSAMSPTPKVKVASVATAFPSGQAPLKRRLAGGARSRDGRAPTRSTW